jgi:lysophospholipase L1-like esterase
VGDAIVPVKIEAIISHMSARDDLRLGVLAFGDSITNGGGELQWGVALQSWALWVARGLGLPFTSYAFDGSRARDVVESQIPVFEHVSANPDGRYELGCLYIGVNDVRAADFDSGDFERDYGFALRYLTGRCERVLTLTIPLDLGRPRAGPAVAQANEMIERIATELGALIVDLREFRARNLVMADRVHPTAFGQIAIAERALAVLERDGLPTRIPPRSVVVFETTWWGRLRGDLTYAYRSLREAVRGRVLH